MSHDEISQIKTLITNLDEKMIQQRSSHHSDLLRQILSVEKKIDDNTVITKELLEHPIFKAWNDGKTLAKIIKWFGISVIGASALLVAIKNGGSILREYLKLAIRI